MANGKDYSYRVYAARSFRDQASARRGQRTGSWPRPSDDQKPPAPPSDLAGASAGEGIYLRLHPQPQTRTPRATTSTARARSGPWVKINQELVVENVFVDKGVKPEQIYYYRIQAVDEAGNAQRLQRGDGHQCICP